MTTNFFSTCTTTDEIKATYRKLAMSNHPDHGGDLETMKLINIEYATVIDRAARAEKPGRTEAEYADMADVSEVLRGVIAQIANVKGIVVEICGTWIWVTGDTYPVKEALKAAGFHWGSKKKAWYFAGTPAHNRREMSLNEIRERHGSEIVRGFRPALALA